MNKCHKIYLKISNSIHQQFHGFFNVQKFRESATTKNQLIGNFVKLNKFKIYLDESPDE